MVPILRLAPRPSAGQAAGIDPLLPFHTGAMNGRIAQEAGVRRCRRERVISIRSRSSTVGSSGLHSAQPRPRNCPADYRAILHRD